MLVVFTSKKNILSSFFQKGCIVCKIMLCFSSLVNIRVMQSYNNQYRIVSVPVMKAWIESYQIPNCMIAEDFWPGNPNNTEPSLYEVATNFINGNGSILNIAHGEPTHWLHVN